MAREKGVGVCLATCVSVRVRRTWPVVSGEGGSCAGERGCPRCSWVRGAPIEADREVRGARRRGSWSGSWHARGRAHADSGMAEAEMAAAVLAGAVLGSEQGLLGRVSGSSGRVLDMVDRIRPSWIIQIVRSMVSTAWALA